MTDVDVVEKLRGAGVRRGDLIGLALAPGVGLGMATASGALSWSCGGEGTPAVVKLVEDALRPRWVWWSNGTAVPLIGAGVRVATCWDIAAVHRLLFGGWRADPARVWAQLHRLALETLPTMAPPDLFTYASDGGDGEDPVQPDGHLRPEWAAGAWARTPGRARRWAELASKVAALQQASLAELSHRPMAGAVARSESTAELLCAELSADGLPMDRAVAEEIVARAVGPRPQTDIEVVDQRAQRDAEVLRYAPTADHVDLRSPGQVRALLARAGIELPDTRAWRLRALAGTHPLVDALLSWRKAERVATTYGYAWLDEHLGDDGRLRGSWTGSDGAAGRMTASAGLHNMPIEMRAAVRAEAGHVFVRADLGQVEPRVLAAVSGDKVLARATLDDDMYAPVAEQLDLDRATAKVAVLGAMYGQTTGDGARALRRLEATYPVAMAYLADAYRSGQAGRDLRTYGGRLVPMSSVGPGGTGAGEDRGAAAARGRYGRNALVQGAAAELFKVWAVTVRARAARHGAQVVLCLHDELLVHVPAESAATVAQLLDDCLQEAAHHWAPDGSARFLADIAVVERWSDAKGARAVSGGDNDASEN
ncbi:MAG: DNA polymerase [Acidimicrobiales bacterium]